MKIFLAKALLRLLSVLPLRLLRAFAVPAATLIGALPSRRNATLKDNLALAFPKLNERELRRLARANRIEMLSTVLEAALLWHRSRDWVERHIVAVEGGESVDRLLAEGRGLLLLGGHLGQWELTILRGHLTLPIAFLYKPPRSAVADRLLSEYRCRFGGEMIPTGGPALRRALRQLRAGRALGMLFDQLPKGGESVQTRFFGRDVATMTLPHRLIRATGCAVAMGHCLRVPGGWKVRVDAVPDADHPDPEVAMAAMNRVLEQVVLEAPEQYLWQYRRFQALPARRQR